MSFYYIGIAKNCTSPANEFLLHACRQTDRWTDGQIFRLTDIYLPPLVKHYSPIISTIRGPNKAGVAKPHFQTDSTALVIFSSNIY